MGLGIEEEPDWCPLRMEHSVVEKLFHRGKKTNTKKDTLDDGRPWWRPKWARDGRCRRKAGRLGAGELGLERSSVAVPSRKAEEPVVV